MQGAANGTVALVGGKRVHASSQPQRARLFTYTVSDGNGGTSTATVTVNVAGSTMRRSLRPPAHGRRRCRRGERRRHGHRRGRWCSTLSFAINGAAPAGLTFNADGSYSFNPGNAAYQSLGANQSTVITVPYR